jgi:hypothetical protein
MKYSLASIMLIFAILTSCTNEKKQQSLTLEETADIEIQQGNFTKADSLIHLILQSEVDDSIKSHYAFQQERMRRIRLDFRRDEAYIKDKLSAYYPELTNDQLRAWEADKSLEMKIIDGQRRYFNWAHRNLFRVNSEAKKKLKLDANQSDGITRFCEDFIPKMIAGLKRTNKTETEDYKFEITYELTVDSGVVKIGDTLRVWLPFPKSNFARQFDIQLLETNLPDYLVAPDDQWHRSVFFERPVSDSGKQDFIITYKVTTRGQWFGNYLKDIEVYDETSPLFKTYTAERLPHIEFSDQIKSITDSIVGQSTEPHEIVRKIYTWIDDNFPWASAREYSTIPNIPAYALENKHADCGIHTLLFMTMARYKGIPAKWQSGWILIPGEVGLHDWAEVYFEGLGWVPVDQSFERIDSEDEDVKYFYTCGVDPYRLIVNDDYSRSFYPPKKHFRSETVDFQRGEVETQDRNLYFNEWRYGMTVKYLE